LAIVVGFLIVLLSSVFFCFQNVVVRVLFSRQPVIGMGEMGGFVTPTLSHSFLLLFMRMLVVVPLMGVLATRLYPLTWKEIKQLRLAEQRPLLWQCLASGVVMFLYLAVLYISIGLIPTGIALTLFFTYPLFTGLLSWRFFGNRPSLFRWGVMAAILVGSALTMPAFDARINQGTWVGIALGIASGFTYAFYTVLAQKSFETIHPVPFTWLSFAIALMLSGCSLLLWNLHEAQLPWLDLWIGGLLSALFTFAGHLLNNYGIRLIGAASAAIVAATNPALTVVLAWFVIQETLTPIQLLGVLIVTLSVALLGWARPQQ
jgi:drug/metabolite transporter (DMT)-like permease